MNQDHDTSQLNPEENSLSDFERLLKGNSPVPVEVDTSIFNVHVVTDASATHVPQPRHAPWPVAAASWFVGLATGLLVAVLAGGAFRTVPAFRPTAFENTASEEFRPPVQHDDTSVAAIDEPAAITPAVPKLLPDYIEAFSPNNPNLARSVGYASRGLLVSLSVTDDASASVRSSQTRASTQYVDPFMLPESTSVGSLRKQLSL